MNGSSVQFGDVVIYMEGGQEFKALVLGERPGNFTYRDGGQTFNEDHCGKNGEPTLTLAFAKQRLDPFKQPLPLHGTGQMSELVQFRTEVAHESHEYSAGAKKHFGRNQYDGGRWREVAVAPPVASIGRPLDQTVDSAPAADKPETEV
jgi:hypothetical protein